MVEYALNWIDPEFSPWECSEFGYGWIRVSPFVALSIPIAYIARWSTTLGLDTLLDLQFSAFNPELELLCENCARIGLTALTISAVSDKAEVVARRLMGKYDIVVALPSPRQFEWELPGGRLVKVCDVVNNVIQKPTLA